MAKKEIKSPVLYGVSRSMDGNKLVIDLGVNGIAYVTITNRKAQWSLYCKPLKITIETSTEEEVKPFMEG